MQLQLTISGQSGAPLGTLASVQAELSEIIPILAFAWSPSGIEKLADLDSRKVEMPSIVRCVLESQPSLLCGSFDNGELHGSFSLGSSDPVFSIFATVGGDEDAGRKFVERLRQRGWNVSEFQDLETVELGGKVVPPVVFQRPTLMVESWPKTESVQRRCGEIE